MRKLVTGRQMKAVDAHAIQEIGIPSMVLMERAALACADELEKRVLACKPKDTYRIASFCGTGNNGADGVAVARILKLRGYDTCIVTVGDESRYTEEMAAQLEIAERLEIPVDTYYTGMDPDFDIVVDAVFGVGLSRDVTGEFAEALNFIEDSHLEYIMAVDIPSGLSSETGAVLGTAVKCDLTVTFGLEKVGMAVYPGKALCGEVVIADIGFPDFDDYEGRRYVTYDREDLVRIPERRSDANKGTYGKVLICAGSAGMCGAAYLSAKAAYRTGAGLVRILTPEVNVPILQTLLPEAIITPYNVSEACEEPEKLKLIVEDAVGWATAVVVGPGIGRDTYVKNLLEYVLLSAYVPIIIDADGLNTISDYPYLLNYFTENVIITPHLKEMSRLTGKDIPELKEDLPESAALFSEEHGIITVLKDAATVVARKDGSVYINGSGCAAMAKGGSGDVLTGAIAGLISLGFSEDDAAAMGVYIHGLAGEKAGLEKGMHSVLAGEIADALMQF